MQKTDEIIAKYAVDANLFQLGSTNSKKNIQAMDDFFSHFFSSKMFQYLKKKL